MRSKKRAPEIMHALLVMEGMGQFPMGLILWGGTGLILIICMVTNRSDHFTVPSSHSSIPQVLYSVALYTCIGRVEKKFSPHAHTLETYEQG